MPLISVRDLSVGYDGRAVCQSINLSLNAGDYLCVVGENGSGKSTLMKTILGLIRPISGQILFGDGLKGNEIGYLPQLTAAQKDFPASVREVVLSGCGGKSGLRPFYTREEKRRAKDSMEKMGVERLSGRCIGELSGGQRQRALLARALCAADKMLLLDEPVTGLDPKATGEMYELISHLNREGMTIMMISHDISSSALYASHMLKMGERATFQSRDEFAKGGGII